MSVSRNYPMPQNANLNDFVQITAQNLTAQGYTCQTTVMSPQTATIKVSKDADGFKNFAGLGVSCNCSITVMGNQANITVDSEWTNKIIALGLGFFLCWILLITGIIGALAQNNLPETIFNTFNMTFAQISGGAMPNQPPYQDPSNNNPQM